MFAEFKHTLRRMRGTIIAWGIGLALYALMMASFYSTVSGMADIMDFVENYPEEMRAFFTNMTAINTPQGYLDTYYFNLMTLIIGVFAIGTGAGLLVNDEERGFLDLILAHPISRSALVVGRVLGYVAATALILLIGWLGWVLPAGRSGLHLSWIEFLRPFVPLLAQLVLFGTLALLLSLLLPASRLAGMVAGALLVANYLLLGLANMNEKLKPIARFTPLYYYQGGTAVSGLNWGWLLGLCLASAVFVMASWLLFQRRDIRVGGERSWRLPRLFRRGQEAPTVS